ncbi:hypothetical protein DFJ77DRAFT_55335 [Powellomyces hirtus]|nr:hypothetical protein DFJ77DRAFT_55335 [Powellomyces hirtus]
MRFCHTDGICSCFSVPFLFLVDPAAEPSVMSGSLPQVISPRQLTNSLSSASFKLGADSEGSDIGGDHSLDNTMHQFGQAHHQHLPQQQQHQLSQRSQDSHCTPPEYQHTTSLDESQQHTPGPHRRGSGRRRSKPYDTSPLEDPASANGKPSKSAAAMARLAEGANKQMEELEDELALKRRRNTEAARRSRERKAVRMQALENQVDQLEALNSSMSHKLGLVEKERAIFAVREAELNRRIQTLEASLREAHDALMARAVESMNMNGAGEGPDQRILPAQLAALAAVAISSSDTTPILTTTVGVSAQATSLLDPKIV